MLQAEQPHLPTVPDPDAALEAEFTKRAAAKAAASTAPVKTDTADSTPAATGDKPNGETAAPVSGAAVTAEDKAKAPDAATTLDLSFLPENVRSQVHFDSEEAAAAVKAGWLAHGAATKKFIEASNLRKEAEALQRSAKNYDALVADPDVALVIKAVEDKRNGKKPAAPAPAEDDPALALLGPDGIAAIDRRTEAKVSAANAEVTRLREEIESITRPTAQRAVFNQTCDAFVAANQVEQDVMAEAIRMADADLAKDGQSLIDVDPKMLPILLRPQVEVARLKKRVPPVAVANKNGAANGQAGTAEVASPVGRGGAHSEQSVPFPKHYVNGQPPRRPRTAAEWAEEDDFRVKLAYGPNATASDVRAASATR
jgi:hypothetical protein